MAKVVLDTDVYSEILRAKNKSVVEKASAYRRDEGCFTLGVVTVVELVKGLQQAARSDRIEQLLRALQGEEILPLDFEAAAIAGRIYGELERSGQTIGRADPLIAAVAVRHNLTLVSGNIEHFQRITQLGFALRLENWRV